ncbi:hypothetical protein [Halalkalicoccus jeotgali]|uniref:Uncharacterized protein n=1 Tax=Halalkalicoccus jeotgali (strain DSM 18796 / CECT 7217 / JCM 14584 / KCTC 4019 / B3) TaxID=795797 RepID=D8J9Z7_HALJB|nr:hypothetical protein [Halalkalicoccus jeotgali]ADJ14519.1 hypothetical protein HacjB3_05640 [Halalkalicoccus jeotgali B3]ELY40092.1 hypothetical protein C497_04010 [Halalkalicoccus jeotgali B3]
MSGSSDIVPEGFDLQEALYARSSTPHEEMRRCPYCESVCLTPNRSQIGRTPGADKWYCTNCGEATSDPLPPEAECGDE